MATQLTRVNPLDLQGNIAVGVSLPFNKSGVFSSTYSTKDQIKSNLINLLLTNKGERPFNPEFGAGIKLFLFEEITEDTSSLIKDSILSATDIFLPEIKILSINITNSNNTIIININYKINISGTADQITVEFT